jgi:hypothetical protein
MSNASLGDVNDRGSITPPGGKTTRSLNELRRRYQLGSVFNLKMSRGEPKIHRMGEECKKKQNRDAGSQTYS